MKKVTFMLIAALMAVISYAQTPFTAGLNPQRLADTNARPVMQARALKGKVVPTTAKRPAKAPAKIIKVTRDEILGSWMQTYVDYFGEMYASSEVTISAAEDDENGIIIAGWWGSHAENLKAKLDPINGTVTIDRQLIYEYTGDTPADFVNVNDTTAAVVGTVVNGAIAFDAPWGAKLENKNSFYAIGLATKLIRPNGVSTFTLSGSQRTAVVAIEQDPETKVATVWNFAGLGSGIDVILNEDKSFLIESQLIYSTSNGDFYTYSMTASGGLGNPEITGTGTETELTFGSNWTGWAEETGYWLNLRSATTITLTDGSTFEYPVLPEVAAVPANPAVTDFWHYDAELGYAQVYVNIPTKDVDGNAIKSALITYQLYAEVNGEQIAVGEPIAYTDETVAIDGVNRIVKISDIAVKTYTRMGVKTIYTAAGETNESAIGWLTIPAYTENAPEGLTLVELPLAGTRTLSGNGGTAAYNATVKFGRSGSDVYIQGLYSLVPEGWVKGTIADGKLTIPAGQYVGIRESNGSRIYTLAYGRDGVGDITFTEKGYNWYASDLMIIESPYANSDEPYYQAYYAAGLTIGTEPPVAAGTYYVYNKVAEKFIAAGDAWGTRAILNTAGIDFGVALAEGKYTLDSRIANSAANHFLNGEFTDGAAFGWTVEKAGDYFTISNGTQYLAAGENDLVMLVDEATDAALWQFRTQADRLAELENATPEAGIDATFLIPGANFGRNDQRVAESWNVSADCTNKSLQGGDNTNMCAESYHSTFTISQLLATAPAGKYQLTAQGFYRQDGDVEEAAPVFFANDNTANVPVKTGSENSMANASVSFTNGLYTIEPIEVLVAATGALTVGVKGTGVNQWVIWDNFRLTYFGNNIDLSELVAAYQNALDAAQNALNNEANAVVTGEERTTLSEVLAANTGVDETSAEALTAAIEALTAATNAFTAAKGSYQALADAKAFVATLSFNYAAADKKAAAEAAAAAAATNAADATDKKDALFVAYRQFAESSALLEGVSGAVNMTDVIANPAAEEAIAEPWTVVNGEGSNGSLDTKSNEPWTDGDGNTAHKYFDGGNWGANSWDVALKQDITLPAGKYQLTVKSRSSAELESFNVFAGEEKVEMIKMGASNGLFNRGWNDNSVVFELAEEATVTIGVQGVTTTLHNWMSFSDFRLVQFPAVEEPDENVLYSWESPEGTPKEYGGVISYENGDGDRLNYPNSGYYTICLNGKKANMDDATPSANAGYMLLTLDNAVSEGDNIAITAYITKDKSAKSSAYLVFETGATAESVFGDEANIHENLGGAITTNTLTVAEEAAGSKTIKMTRNQTGTNLFITKLVITKAEPTVGITNVNANDFQNGAIYNLRGQRVEKATKGLYIINGKKVVLK